MFDQDVKSSTETPALQASLDSPAAGESIYDEAIFLSGWVYAPGRDPATCRVHAWLDDCCVAETRMLFYRPDVCEHLGLTHDMPTGFRMLGKIRPAATEARTATLRIIASWEDGVSTTLAEQPVRLVPALLRERPHGEVVSPDNEILLHRENIYGSGPPLEDPGIEVTNLLRQYLPERSSVVDVGCGAGAYGPGLIAAGHSWLGLETNSHCCDILLRRQLPFRRVHLESRDLPCAGRRMGLRDLYRGARACGRARRFSPRDRARDPGPGAFFGSEHGNSSVPARMGRGALALARSRS